MLINLFFSLNRQWALHEEFYYVSRVEMTDILTYSFQRFAIDTRNFLTFPLFLVTSNLHIRSTLSDLRIFSQTKKQKKNGAFDKQKYDKLIVNKTSNQEK